MPYDLVIRNGTVNCPCAVPGLCDGPADIIVYHIDELEPLPSERVTDWPGSAWHLDRHAKGWRWTLVNGEATFEDGACTGATPGSLLRHGHA